MPPKPKITHEDILRSAYNLVLREGCGSLSSRNVAQAAGCSVQPVFSHFPTMDSLRAEVYQYACRQCADEVLNDNSGKDLPTVLTLWMLDLAKNRPNLFELLYLSDLSLSCSLPKHFMKAENHQKMLEICSKIYGISVEESEDLLIRSCIFLMGIGTMICINKVDIPEEVAIGLMHETVKDFVSGLKNKV